MPPHPSPPPPRGEGTAIPLVPKASSARGEKDFSRNGIMLVFERKNVVSSW